MTYLPQAVQQLPEAGLDARVPIASRQRKSVRPLPWPVLLLLAYVAGITIIGKGPTYLGYPPLFWGEVVMAVSLLLIAPLRPQVQKADPQRAFLSLLIALWLTLGMTLTLRALPEWKLDALRDAATVYYALFYFVGLGLAAQEQIADRVWKVLVAFWVIALIWGTADLLSGKQLSMMGPVLPWRGVPILFNARDETGQNLALGALLVIGTHMLRKHPFLRVALIGISIVGLGSLLGSEGRAVRLGFLAAVSVLVALSFAPKPITIARRARMLVMTAVPVTLVLLLTIPDLHRKAQLDRFSEESFSEKETTAYWRLLWWERLLEEVVERNPAFGLGFGESLHVYHPALENLSDPWMLRAPHNIHVTVLARMGFVGLMIWILILVFGIGTLFFRVWRGRSGARICPKARREELAFWVAMLVYTIVNSSFGVLMEGPVLGIWFWLALGFAFGRCGDWKTARESSLQRRKVIARLALLEEGYAA